jgi:hypothetical protein
MSAMASAASEWFATPLRQAAKADSMSSAQKAGCRGAHRDAPPRLPPTAMTEYTVVLTADGVLGRSARRRQTPTGWNTPYIGANRYTLPPDAQPPADDVLHPMAFLVEKHPGAVTRPHFHQTDQFQVVVAGRGMLVDHEIGDGAVHYTDAYSAYGPIVAGKSGIWWFTLRNRWDPGARYMPAEREALNAARDRDHRHWELTTEATPSALLDELREATEISSRPVLEAADGLAGWRYRIPPRTAITGPAPSAGGGQFWLVLAGAAAVDGGDPLPANSCIFVGPDELAFAGASGPLGAELLCLQFRRRRAPD